MSSHFALFNGLAIYYQAVREVLGKFYAPVLIAVYFAVCLFAFYKSYRYRTVRVIAGLSLLISTGVVSFFVIVVSFFYFGGFPGQG